MEYLRYCQSFVVGTGLVTNSPSFRKFLGWCFLLPLSLIVFAFSIYKIRDTDNDIFLMIEVMESISSFTQLMIRKYIIFIQGELMLEIFNECENLWSFDLFGPQLSEKFKQQMKNCWTLAKVLITSGFITIVLMCISALTDKTKSLPFICWVPNFSYAHELIFLSQFILLIELLYYVVATDGFYLLICMDIQIQYKMMGKMLKSVQFGVISEEESWEKLVELANHHNKMLHEKLNKVFSKYYIIQYAISVSAMSAQVYTLMYSKVVIETALKSICYTISLLLQVAYYFFPASNMEIEAEKFSTKIYFLNWQDNADAKIRKHILFMLLKSQKSLEMWGEGMLHINRNEYLLIFRLGFTIATLLSGFK
ncbi:odorant receptor 135 [Tribolium castaneum]|uniref:Odorant receptor n=1 Tax=Tribolium castaneum TaxID=7070 RepID=D1ZZK5_TRICA|nr:odorant receptor 135 [Tribolium castaneum]